MAPADEAVATAMRQALWPDEDQAELARETLPMLLRHDYAVFGACDEKGNWIGFVEVGQRDVAESCTTSPVGYVEGLWVDASARRQGVGRALVAAAADWSRSRGYREMASDTNLDNTLSQAVHARLGFAETDRIVTFRISLD